MGTIYAVWLLDICNFKVMCSYNSVNGIPTCLDKDAIMSTLRGKFGFDGMVVSDCDSIANAWQPQNHNYTHSEAMETALGIKAGCDMNCGTT